VKPLKARQSTSNSELRCNMLLHVIGNGTFHRVIWLQTASTVSCNSRSRNTNLVTFLEINSAVTFQGELEVLGESSLNPSVENTGRRLDCIFIYLFILLEIVRRYIKII
jgi:hypothetical protein